MTEPKHEGYCLGVPAPGGKVKLLAPVRAKLETARADRSAHTGRSAIYKVAHHLPKEFVEGDKL